MSSAEQVARDILHRCGVPDAHRYSSGDVVELANLIGRVRELEAEQQELKSLLQDGLNIMSDLGAAGRRVAELETEQKRLRDALEWYAQAQHYDGSEPLTLPDGTDCYVSLVENDGGQRARAALRGDAKRQPAVEEDGPGASR